MMTLANKLGLTLDWNEPLDPAIAETFPNIPI